MSKRCMGLMLALLLLVSATAFAANETRVDFGETFSLTRPMNLETIELTEDDQAEGIVYAAVSDELEMYVQRYEMEGMTKDELYAMYLEDDFLQDVAVTSRNGIEYIRYTIVDEGIGATCLADDGYYYEFNFYCLTDDALEAAEAILASIEPIG